MKSLLLKTSNLARFISLNIFFNFSYFKTKTKEDLNALTFKKQIRNRKFDKKNFSKKIFLTVFLLPQMFLSFLTTKREINKNWMFLSSISKLKTEYLLKILLLKNLSSRNFLFSQMDFDFSYLKTKQKQELNTLNFK